MLNGVFMGKWWVLYSLAPHGRPVIARFERYATQRFDLHRCGIYIRPGGAGRYRRGLDRERTVQRESVARSANGNTVRDRVHHVPLGGKVALALAMANTVVLNLSRNEIHRIIPAARKTEVQAVISGVGAMLLDNATPEVRAHVFVVIVNALLKGLSLGIAVGALSVALSFFMEKEKIALKAPPKQGETGVKSENGIENK